MGASSWRRRGEALAPALVVLLAAGAMAGCGGEERVETPAPPPAADERPSPPRSGEPAAFEGEAEAAEHEPVLPVPETGEELNPLTGLPVPIRDLERRVFLVAVDNHPHARPQTGLAAADLVYELPVEGGITRFVALYWAGGARRIGPVRSSRHDFLDLVLEWRAAWVHAGGSPQHYEQIEQLRIADLDDMRGGGVFWRDEERSPPHNLYTTAERVRAQIAERGWRDRSPAREPWRHRLPRDLPGGDPVPAFTVNWPGLQNERETFRYDPERGRYGAYARSVDGELQVDVLTGEPLTAANVIAQFVAVRPIPGDSEGRLDADMVGRGRTLIFSAGSAREGRWRKLDRPSPTVYAEADGEPLTLVPGQTWVLIVPADTRIEGTEPEGSG